MHEIERTVIIPLPALFGIDMSITNEIVLLWIAALACFTVLTLACRRQTLVATGIFPNLMEALIEFIDRSAGREVLGRQASRWSRSMNAPATPTPRPHSAVSSYSTWRWMRPPPPPSWRP